MGNRNLVFLLGVMMVFLLSINVAEADVSVQFEPNYISDDSYNVGDTIELALTISDVENFIGFDISLEWNPEYLNLDSIDQSTFLTDIGMTMFLTSQIDNTLGNVESITEYGMGAEGADGSGTLVTFTFSIVSKGFSRVNLTKSIMTDDAYVPIPHTVLNAIINTSSEQIDLNPVDPVADFTPQHESRFIVSEQIELDASISKDGLDTLPEPETVPITSWNWTIDMDDDGVIDYTFSGEKILFTPEKIGKYNIILVVNAPDKNEKSEAYNETDKVSKIIYVEQVSALNVKVYTDRGGPDEDAVAYGPQELVSIKVEVLINDAPVANNLVLVEVMTNNSEVFSQRTVFTNQDGIGNTIFRLPWTDKDPEAFFGTWHVQANVKVGDLQAYDSVKIKFKYVIKPVDMWISDTQNFALTSISPPQTMRLNLILQNDLIFNSEVLVSIMIEDGLHIPINWNYLFITLPSKSTIPLAIDLTIPSWAYEGEGSIYINMYDNLPNNAGHAYCTETIIPIVIN